MLGQAGRMDKYIKSVNSQTSKMESMSLLKFTLMFDVDGNMLYLIYMNLVLNVSFKSQVKSTGNILNKTRKV